MATEGFICPLPAALVSHPCDDDDAMDFEEFNNIMQEPPDPNLKDQSQPDLFSFFPIPVRPAERASSSLRCAEEIDEDSKVQASSTFRCSEVEDFKLQADLNHTLQEDDIDCLHSSSPQSSQSDTGSNLSMLMQGGQPWMEQSIDQNMSFLFDYSFPQPFTNDFGATNLLDDSKSNGSTTTTDSKPQEVLNSTKVLVDLTNDSESDYEEEYPQSYTNKLSGKRSLPPWVKPVQNPPKAPCLRNSSQDGFGGFNMSLEKSLSFNNNYGIHKNSDLHYGNSLMAASSLDPRSARTVSTSVLPDNMAPRFTMFTKQDCLDDGIMTVPLLKHQRIALAWMQLREIGTECAGGILADDQGLGKTVSTISLILKSKPQLSSRVKENSTPHDPEASTVDLDDDDPPMHKHTSATEPVVSSKGRPAAGTLIVCPTSVIRQWAQELKEKITDAHSLSVHLYHGSNRTKDPLELAKHDVVLTTYSIVTMEVPKQPLPDEKESDDRNPNHYGFSGSDKGFVMNSKKKVGKGKKGDSDNVDNAKAGPLAKVAWFRVVLDEAQSIKNRRTQAARACWGLRAKRRWCLSGTPIQNTIDDLYSYFRFLRYEPFSAYKEFRSKIKDPISRHPDTGYISLQKILQKVFLRRTKTTLIDGEPIISLPKKTVKLEQVDFSAEERAFYSNLEVQSRAQFQMYAAQGTVQSNYVNILWMLLRLRQACDHPRLVKGAGADIGKTSTEHTNNLSNEKRASLLSVLEETCETCSICSDAPEDPVITSCLHVFCRQCIYDKVAHDDTASCPKNKCHAPLSRSKIYSLSDLKDSESNSQGSTEPSLDLLMQPCFNDVPESSSKIRAVINTLRALPVYEVPIKSVENDDSSDSAAVRTEKAIVFSQWTSMLDLLEVSLQKEGFCYRRLDGTMSIQARDRALSDFKTLPNVTVIIMSLKAASLGLNMVTASHVLLIDVWWNPTTEDQAIDRAHRIGQTREVHVSRFTVKNTIEDRILQLQDKKRRIVSSAFGEDPSSDQKTRLTVDDMRFLFRA